jgi:hypothetical protein
MDTIQR